MKIDGIKQLDEARPARAESAATSMPRANAENGRQAASADGKAPPVEESKTRQMAVIEAANAISSFVQNVSRELQFNVDDQTGRTIITVMDRNTDQVIRQIPGDEALALAKVLEESPSAAPRGMLINSEA